MKIKDDIDAACKFDKNRKHRYFLSYIWKNQKPLLGVILFNPSTADEHETDPTHARLINKFCDKYGGIQVLNLISFISTNPKELNNINENSVNVDVLNHLDEITANDILLAWGTLPKKLQAEKRQEIDKAIMKMLKKFKEKKKKLYQLNEDKIVHPLIRKKTSQYKFKEENLIKFS